MFCKISYNYKGVEKDVQSVENLVVDIGNAIFKIEKDEGVLKVTKLYPENQVENIHSASGVTNPTIIE